MPGPSGDSGAAKVPQYFRYNASTVNSSLGASPDQMLRVRFMLGFCLKGLAEQKRRHTDTWNARTESGRSQNVISIVGLTRLKILVVQPVTCPQSRCLSYVKLLSSAVVTTEAIAVRRANPRELKPVLETSVAEESSALTNKSLSL